MIHRSFLFVVFAAFAVVESQKVLQIHSFDQSIDHATFIRRWYNAGTSIPLESHIVLSPSVPDRFGAQWHKYPVLTDDFEVTFRVMIKGPSDGSNPRNDQGFAFWYVYENVTAVIPEDITHESNDVMMRMASKGWGLFGYKNQFKGLGVLFSNNKYNAATGTSDLKPSVSMVVNDGSRTVVFPNEIPTPFGSYWNYRSEGLNVRVRIQKSSILLEAKPDNGSSWLKLAEIPSDKMSMQMTSGGYLGFSGFVAADKPGAPPSKFGQNDAVHIDKVVVTNMDSKQKGEEPIADASPNEAEPSADPSEFLHDKSEEGLERAEGKAIKTLSRMIFKLISETEPLKKSLTAAVGTLSRRLMGMERAVKKLKEEIVSLSGHDMDSEYAKMKQELSQLSSQAMSDVENKKREFETLKSEIETSLDSKNAQKRSSSANVVKTLHEADMKARDLKRQVSSRGSFTVYIVIFCLVLVVAAGVALQAKLRRWEKKHLL
jgi:hypothetical protein